MHLSYHWFFFFSTVSFAYKAVWHYLYSRNICKKQKLFLCLKFLHCGVWIVNSGFVFGCLVPCPYGHIPGTFLYVCKGYSSRTYLPNSFPKNSVKSLSLIWVQKKRKTLTWKSNFFKKIWELPKQLPKAKNQVILLYWTAEDQTSNREME